MYIIKTAELKAAANFDDEDFFLPDTSHAVL
jgi:hypothetical protein